MTIFHSKLNRSIFAILALMVTASPAVLADDDKCSHPPVWNSDSHGDS